MREKLIEFLDKAHKKPLGKEYRERLGNIADHLIANGVTIVTDNNVGDKLTPTDKDTTVLTNGVTVQEWISASEPPKDTYEYWIAYKAGGDYFYSTGYFDGKCWRSAITHKQIPVTHWQHLPQPPKEE